MHTNSPNMYKILGAGIGGAMRHQREMNIFLKAYGLPDAEFVQKEENQGFMKDYFVLYVEKGEWNTKIRPIKEAFSEYVSQLVKVGAQALEGEVPRVDGRAAKIN